MHILVFIVLYSITFAYANTNIKESQKQLANITKERNNIAEKLKILGNEINKKDKRIKQLDSEISGLEKNINENKLLFTEQEKKFQESKALESILTDKKNIMQKELVNTILKDMVIYMVLNSKEAINEDSIMSEEILKEIGKKTREKIDKITNEHVKISTALKEAQKRIDESKKIIETKEAKITKLQSIRKENSNLKNKMKAELNAYNKELVKLDNERMNIQKVLVELNILKEQSSTAKLPETSGTILPPIEVRQIGSTYRPVNTAKYKGVKTIAPLKQYKIEMKYGQHIDPVYKMKVFNEFITFSVEKNSPVLNVLDGKVVFAKDTSFAKKMIVIEHKNGLHSIYSYLDSIANNISVGSVIKKGVTIASIDDKLNFEVTQKDKHINPLDLINVK